MCVCLFQFWGIGFGCFQSLQTEFARWFIYPFVGGFEPLPYKRGFKMMKFMSPVLAKWFQRFFIFTPSLGGMIQFDSYFSDGLVQPPTSHLFFVDRGPGTSQAALYLLSAHSARPWSRLKNSIHRRFFCPPIHSCLRFLFSLPRSKLAGKMICKMDGMYKLILSILE